MTAEDSQDSEESDEGTQSVTRADIEEYEEEHDEAHPVFEVEYRPERQPTASGCLWGECDSDEAALVEVFASNGDSMKSRVCATHREEAEAQPGVTVEVLDTEHE